MKLYLISLSVLFLISCDTKSDKKSKHMDEKSEISSIEDQARTILQEIEAFEANVHTKSHLTVTKKAVSPNVLVKLENYKKTLATLVASSKEAYRVIKRTARQEESSANEEEIKQSIKTAKAWKNQITLYRDQAEEIRNQVHALTNSIE